MGDVARVPEHALVAMLGPAAGRHLHALARNHDPRTVVTGRRRSSIGSQRALGRRCRSHEELDGILLGLVERVTERLRAGRRVGRTLTLRFRTDDLTRRTRSRTMPEATDRTDLFADAVQLSLPLDGHDHRVLDHVLDDVRDRFGAASVVRASLLDRHGMMNA